MTDELKTKKADDPRDGARNRRGKVDAAEIDQLRRKLIAEHGEEGKTGADYVADVLKAAGLKVNLSQLEEVETS